MLAVCAGPRSHATIIRHSAARLVFDPHCFEVELVAYALLLRVDQETTELHHAAATGDITTLSQYLSPDVVESYNLDEADANGRTPAVYATLGEQYEALELLLNAGAQVCYSSSLVSNVKYKRQPHPWLWFGIRIA